MAGFNEYPYRDYSGYNLDYILEKTGNAEAALLAAEQASATARTAQQTAAAARAEAEAATQTAETAQRVAEGIADTADQALTEAAAARQAATDAGSTALSAVTTANNAVSTANAAQSSADAAGTAAAAAQTSADAAGTAAATNAAAISALQEKTTYLIRSAASSTETALPANAPTVLTFNVDVPSGYTIVSAGDDSYYANVISSIIRISGSSVIMNYYSPTGISTVRRYQIKCLLLKI